ncbi:MAG: SH3 domain-containing protein [Chloroflexota bacterium]
MTLLLTLSLTIGLVLVGCATGVPIQPIPEVITEAVIEPGDIVSLDAYLVPTPMPEPTPDPNEIVSVVIDTGGSRANLRDAPSTDSSILGKGYPGDIFEVVGQTEDGEWLQICCIPGADGTDVNTWVATELTQVAGDDAIIAANDVPVVDESEILTNEMTAQWLVDWSCNSDRCEVSTCQATVTAQVAGSAATDTQQWLPIEHRVQWGESCFSEDAWVFEVNRFTGSERTGEFSNNFLYGYWLGTEDRTATNVFVLNEAEGIAVECDGPYAVEIEEGDGWTTVYEGETCHDLQTGMLLYMEYTKRWLFTGEYEGQQYDRAYFGDSEKLVQRLVDTNINLMVVTRQ